MLPSIHAVVEIVVVVVGEFIIIEVVLGHDVVVVAKVVSKVSSTFHSSIRSRPCWGGRCCPPYTLPSIQRPTCR